MPTEQHETKVRLQNPYLPLDSLRPGEALSPEECMHGGRGRCADFIPAVNCVCSGTLTVSTSLWGQWIPWEFVFPSMQSPSGSPEPFFPVFPVNVITHQSLSLLTFTSDQTHAFDSRMTPVDAGLDSNIWLESHSRLLPFLLFPSTFSCNH